MFMPIFLPLFMPTYHTLFVSIYHIPRAAGAVEYIDGFSAEV